MLYKQTKQEVFTSEVNTVLNRYGKYMFEYIAPCSIDKRNSQSTSVNDYTKFTDRYVEENLIKIDPILHWVENSQRTYVSFDEFNLIENVKIQINGNTQLINGKLVNYHRSDCKIINGFYYIERHLFHNYLIIFGTKSVNFDLLKDIFLIKEKKKWLKNIQSELIRLMADMNSAIFVINENN
jgi:transcriptional regulator of heat shock response